MISYRKTKNGVWVVCGPASEVRVGPVNVRTKSGAVKTETVTGLGKPFATSDGPMIYGYIEPRMPSTRRRGKCGCDCDECSRGCRCEPHCNCRGGNIYDC